MHPIPAVRPCSPIVRIDNKATADTRDQVLLATSNRNDGPLVSADEKGIPHKRLDRKQTMRVMLNAMRPLTGLVPDLNDVIIDYVIAFVEWVRTQGSYAEISPDSKIIRFCFAENSYCHEVYGRFSLWNWPPSFAMRITKDMSLTLPINVGFQGQSGQEFMVRLGYENRRTRKVGGGPRIVTTVLNRSQRNHGPFLTGRVTLRFEIQLATNTVAVYLDGRLLRTEEQLPQLEHWFPVIYGFLGTIEMVPIG